MIQVKTARWWVLSNPSPQNIQRCFQNRLVAGTKNPLRDGQEEFLLQSTSPNWRCGVRSVEVGHCNADMCRRVPLNVHRYFGKVNPSNFLRWKSGHRSRDSHMTGYHHAQVSKQPDPSNPWGPQQPLHTKLEARKLPLQPRDSSHCFATVSVISYFGNYSYLFILETPKPKNIAAKIYNNNPSMCQLKLSGIVIFNESAPGQVLARGAPWWEGEESWNGYERSGLVPSQVEI